MKKKNQQPKVKAPTPSKASEREFARMMEYMVELASRIYRNQALEALNVRTVNKFADAQKGNYAKVFLTLAQKVERKLRKRFDDDRIEKMAKQVLSKVDDNNKRRFYAEAEKKLGINVAQAMAKEGLTSQRNALFLETAQWAKKHLDETLETYTANSLRAMAQGESLDDIMTQFDGMVEKRKNQAKFTARNQIANYNSLATKLRAEKIGMTRAVWVTADDGKRVRPSHEARDGKEFDLDEGLYSSIDGKTLLPGTDYNCRCTYALIIPGEEED